MDHFLRIRVLAPLVSGLAACGIAHAVEGGSSNYLLGMKGPLAAFVPKPGVYLTNNVSMNTQPIPRRPRWIPALRLVLGALLTTAVIAQEVLPFPPTPSASKAGLTMQDSTYKKRVEPRRLEEGAPNILIILMDAT